MVVKIIQAVLLFSLYSGSTNIIPKEPLWALTTFTNELCVVKNHQLFDVQTKTKFLKPKYGNKNIKAIIEVNQNVTGNILVLWLATTCILAHISYRYSLFKDIFNFLKNILVKAFDLNILCLWKHPKPFTFLNRPTP